MKNTYFFPHDYHARHDPKLERLFLKLGYEGVGIYWCLIEAMYEQGGALLLSDIPLYAKGDDSLCERIATIINDFDLFIKDDVGFWSESCVERLQKVTEKSKKASNSAKRRWNNANAMPTQCEGNAIRREEKRVEEKMATLNYFYLKYEKASGKPYAVAPGKDYQIFADLALTHKADEIKALIDKFFASKDKFILEAGRTVGVFNSQINKLQAGSTEPKTRITA
jgi:uncharacterized protein YdaU (DUF1376 family)